MILINLNCSWWIYYLYVKQLQKKSNFMLNRLCEKWNLLEYIKWISKNVENAMISSPLISRIWNEEIRIYCLKLYGVRIIIFVRTLLNKVSVLYSTLIENFALFIFGFSLSKYHPRQMMGVRSRSSIHNPFILGMKKIYLHDAT